MNPIPMMCEFGNCNSTNVRDYKRLPKDQEPGWEDEPIALCPEHAGERQPITVNPYINLPENNDN